MWGAPPEFDTPLGWEHPVVVRDLDLARSPWNRSELKLRWKALRDAAHTDSATLITFMCKDEPRLNNRAFFKGRRDRSAVVLAAAPDGLPVLHRILNAAVPIILWPRRPCPDHDDAFESCAGARFSAELLAQLDPFNPDALPQKVMELRHAAGDDPDGAGCGKDLTLIWDDPTRRPADDLGLA
jgi:hypothetical protein